jgi:hypothetical protein
MRSIQVLMQRSGSTIQVLKQLSAALLASVLLSHASAGQLFDPITVHPAEPQRGQPVLIKVESFWPSGCGGSISVEAAANRVDVVLDSGQPSDRLCTSVIVPIVELINPADFLPNGARLSDEVEVRLLRRNSSNSAPEKIDEDRISFTANAPKAKRLPTGSFSSAELETSGLFLDQQDSMLSTLLSDYDTQGKASWRFGAGSMHGDVYVGSLPRYQQVQCITAPCPRAAPADDAKINVLVLNPNELVVSYRNALSPGLRSTYRYQRLVFNRAAELPNVSAEDGWVPDLGGTWLIGVLGTSSSNAELRRFEVKYLGAVDNDSGLNRRTFFAQSGQSRSDNFSIVCTDARPVDGIIDCRIESFLAQLGTCETSFEPVDVAADQVRATANCGKDNASVETEFFMQRLSR